MDETMLLKSIGLNIKNLRIERKLTQQELAADCNIEVPNLSLIENGKTNLTIRTLHKISIALKTNVKDLVDASLI